MTNKNFETGLLPDSSEYIHLFRPHIPRDALKILSEVLESRWIGQGPKVEEFEQKISTRFCGGLPGIAVGSGTDALHLAYLLAGVKPGDEVIVPLFTCTATSIPLLYIGAKPVFIDIDPKTLNMDASKIEAAITAKTKAITVVHYGGLPCDMTEINKIAKAHNLQVIEDAAHALGAKYNEISIGSISDFTVFSFQAIKHLTTGDGGYLSIKNHELIEKAKRLRWFGIDRSAKQLGIWENDITEIGYKYQLTDLAAAIGLAGLDEYESTLNHRKSLFKRYQENLTSSKNTTILNNDLYPNKFHAAWMFTIASHNRREIQIKLFQNNIESNQVHYRNDRYSIFAKSRGKFNEMDKIEDQYLVLPLHTKMSTAQVDKVCEIILSFDL
jgi:dTDP-4-amino-4,6-dideoxygalactose transaminase